MQLPTTSRFIATLSAAYIVVCASTPLLGCSQGQDWSAAGSAPEGGSSSGGGTAADAGGTPEDGSGPAIDGGSAEAGTGGPTLALPIEVLGTGAPDDPAIASTTLPLASADIPSVQFLYVKCHRCGFYDPPEFETLAKPLVKVKASLRIDGGATTPSNGTPWIDVTNANVQVDAVSLAHGGINGAQVTVSFLVPVDDTTRARLVGLPGANQIEFRFNGTDGNSNGYRILDVAFRDGNGNDLSHVTRSWANISAEKAPTQYAASDATAGQALWVKRNSLVKSTIVNRTIRAACSDCHAADGRDLEYFNYSNNSIVQRSRFHGLSQQQGQQIAAFLRVSLSGQVPDVPAAAPWNPPYQPGPGLDSKPAAEWTAGAGIDAVLPDGKAFVNAFVGQPTNATSFSVTQAQMTAAMDPTKTLNMREMPIPMQLPDWNAWLPIVHPLDLWPPDAQQTTGLFEQGYQGGNPLNSYTTLEAWLDMKKDPTAAYGDWSNLSANDRSTVQGMLLGFGGSTSQFGGGSRGTRVSSDPNNPFGVQLAAQKMQALLDMQTAALADLTTCGPIGPCTPFNTDSFIERADVGLYHWMAVKQWEIVEKYGLQAQQSFHGSVSNGSWQGQGEARGWPYGWPSLFYVAPHILYAPTQTGQGLREFYFSWENRLVSYYRTDSWYALQVTINPGWPGASNGGVDWPYTQGFIAGLADDLNTAHAPGWVTAAHLARYFEVNTKLAQLANTNIPFDQPNPSNPGNIYQNAGMQSKADLLFKLSPAVVMDPHANQPGRFRLLDQIAPGVYLLFVNASISMYADLYFNTMPGQYRVCDPNNTQMGTPEQFAGMRFCVDASRTPLPTDSQGQPYCPYPANDGYTTQQFDAWGLLEGAREGADAALMQRWSTWDTVMWP